MQKQSIAICRMTEFTLSAEKQIYNYSGSKTFSLSQPRYVADERRSKLKAPRSMLMRERFAVHDRSLFYL